MGAFGDRSEPGARLIAFKAGCDGWAPLLRGYRASNIRATPEPMGGISHLNGVSVYIPCQNYENLWWNIESSFPIQHYIRGFDQGACPQICGQIFHFFFTPKLVREMWRARYLWGTLSIFFTQQVPFLCWFMSPVYVCACFLLDF